MKKYLLCSFAALCLATATSAFAGDSVYKIGFSIKGAHTDDFGDDLGKAIAASLTKSKLAANCVDLRQTGAAISGAHFDGGYGLISHYQPTTKELKAIEKAICKDYLGCSVTPTITPYAAKDLKVSAETFERDPNASDLAPGKALVKAVDGKLPRFSKGCDTGSYADSWNDAASTPESRAYLKKIGINIRQARTLSLVDKNGDEVWTFGFPNVDRSGDTAGTFKKPTGGKDSGNGG
ncbi:MAG: hypothetical protein JST04_11335 [Bdellovibrionales bacterium]|nr:hypothetical protein [Bdellovibrionales bacterium]